MKLLKKTTLKKEYISVDGSFGGNQRWLRKDADKANTLSNYGCGLISANDVLLHISDKADNPSKEKYIAAVREMNRRYFHILPFLGISGILLSFYIRIYLLMHRKHFKVHYKVRWGVMPHNILKRITEMIENDIPVILSIGPAFIRRRKEKLPFYTAKITGDDINFTPATQTKDHYVNVTGVYETIKKPADILKNTSDKDKQCTIYLEISSWGRKYYINYAEYIEYIKKHDNFLFSNILYIHS
ncbi:MAG: hypothetical protein IJ763_10240 [Lachnospiraceae bacterium]|nr:hypothetical protein [Lachnospiraceae bacterium]